MRQLLPDYPVQFLRHRVYSTEITSVNVQWHSSSIVSGTILCQHSHDK